jgi:hypothetical protein
VQYGWGEKSKEALQQLGMKVDFHTYRGTLLVTAGMGHESCDEELRDFALFLRSLL